MSAIKMCINIFNKIIGGRWSSRQKKGIYIMVSDTRPNRSVQSVSHHTMNQDNLWSWHEMGPELLSSSLYRAGYSIILVRYRDCKPYFASPQ